MVIYDDAVPVVGTVIVTLAEARLYNPRLVNVADASAQLSIDAATCYLLGHPGLTISDITGPYPACVKQITSSLASFIWSTANLNGAMLSESLGDYSYTSGLGIALSANPVVQLTLAMLSNYIRRSAPVSVRRDETV
jgi:hypothetical protein